MMNTAAVVYRKTNITPAKPIKNRLPSDESEKIHSDILIKLPRRKSSAAYMKTFAVNSRLTSAETFSFMDGLAAASNVIS